MKTKLLFFFTILLSMDVWAYDAYIDGIYYNLNTEKKEAEVTYKEMRYSTYNKNVIIPSSVTFSDVTYKVTRIGDYAFYGSSVTDVEIPNSITSFGEYAFYSCKGLTSIDIPNSVTSIGAWAFNFCNFTSIDIPNSVTSIGRGAFQGCYSLTSIIIPNSVTSISNDLFRACIGLISIEIPNSVTSIGNDAFYNCKKMTSIEIPNSVTSIGETAFANCSGLTSIEIPNSVTSISKNIFYQCYNLSSIIIPNSVTNIDEQAFYCCTGLTSIVIPNSVTHIDGYAFSGCTGLTSLRCDALTPPVVGHYAFIDIKKNCTLYVPAESLNDYSSADEWKEFETIKMFSTDENGIFYTLNSETKEAEIYLGPKSYSGSLYIPSEITNSSDTYSVTSICKEAFRDCLNLTSVVIPNSVKSIGSYAFYGCADLISIGIPNSVNIIYEQAFNNTAWYNNQPDGLVYAGNVAYKFKGDMPENTSVCLKDETTGIANSAFSNCTDLITIVIPKSVTNIGGNAFAGCKSLKSILCEAKIPPMLGTSVFTNVNKSTCALSVPEESINAYKASDQWKDFLTIKAPVFKIIYMVDGEEYKTYDVKYGTAITPEVEPVKEDYTFSGWSEIPETMPAEDVTVVGSFTKIDYTLIYLVDGLEYVIDTKLKTAQLISSNRLGEVVIPESVIYEEDVYNVVSIGEKAFENMVGLTSVDIPNSVTSICESAFRGCANLTSLTIPESVTSIGDYAFAGCQLFGVVIRNVSLECNGFSDISYRHATLYIPEGKWRQAVYGGSGWNNFNIIKEVTVETGNLNSSRAYMIMNAKTKNFLVYDAADDCLDDTKACYNVNENNENDSWQVVEKNDNYYLYNIGVKKFANVKSEGQIELNNTAQPVEIVQLRDGVKIGNQTWLFVVNNNIETKNIDPDATGIDSVISNSEDEVQSYFDINGRKNSTLQKGVNIVKKANGTPMKIYVK